MDIPIAQAGGCTCTKQQEFGTVGKQPCSAAWIHGHIPPRRHWSPTPSCTPGQAPWLGVPKGARCHLWQDQRPNAFQPAVHHQILTQLPWHATPGTWSIALGALALILKSQWGIEGNVFVLWRCSVTCLEQAREELQGCQIQLFPGHHSVKRMKARILVSKWITLPALQHFKYLSC